MVFDDVYIELLPLLSEVGADPGIPIESEQFFSHMVENFSGSKEEFLDYVRSHRKGWFSCISKRPEWIQNCEWPFSDGNPMVFVGQVDIPFNSQRQVFHDDASFYVFWNPKTGETQVVVQVA